MEQAGDGFVALAAFTSRIAPVRSAPRDVRRPPLHRPEASDRGALTGKVMQAGHSRFSFPQERGTSGTARDGIRFQPIINKERSGQHTVTFRLQKAVVIKVQLYE